MKMMLTPEDQAWIDEQMTLAGRPPAPKLEDYVPRDHDFTRGEYIMRKGMWRHAHAEWAANDLRHSTIYVPPPAVQSSKLSRDWRDLIGGLMIVAFLVFLAVRAYQLGGLVALAWMLPCVIISSVPAALLAPRKNR